MQGGITGANPVKPYFGFDSPALSASRTRSHPPCSRQACQPDPLTENGRFPEKSAMESGAHPHWKNPDEEKAVLPLCVHGRHFPSLRNRCRGKPPRLASWPIHGCPSAFFPASPLLSHAPWPSGVPVLPQKSRCARLKSRRHTVPATPTRCGAPLEYSRTASFQARPESPHNGRLPP